MAIEVDGVPILSQGEFVALTKSLPEDYTGSGVLQGLWAGESFHPATVFAAFTVGLRLTVETDDGEDIVERVLQRLRDGFPDAGFPKRPESD